MDNDFVSNAMHKNLSFSREEAAERITSLGERFLDDFRYLCKRPYSLNLPLKYADMEALYQSAARTVVLPEGLPFSRDSLDELFFLEPLRRSAFPLASEELRQYIRFADCILHCKSVEGARIMLGSITLRTEPSSARVSPAAKVRVFPAEKVRVSPAANVCGGDAKKFVRRLTPDVPFSEHRI